jgi:predicted Mrr-cat superfamily restriction endonuclease
MEAMMNINVDQDPVVWGVFVGEAGGELAHFNSENNEFPPKSGSEGYVAIGWAGIGDMRLYKGQPDDFEKKFQMIYPHKTRLWINEVWNFAYVMKDDDYIISPSSSLGYLLVGRVVGEYLSDYDNWESVAKKKNRSDLMHLRRVRWLHAIRKDDPRYQSLHRIGLMTVSRPSITASELLNLVDPKAEN